MFLTNCNKLKHLIPLFYLILTKNTGIFIGKKHLKISLKMNEFQRQIANGFVIETVNLYEVTITEALRFKKQLELDIELGNKNIIVDLSICNSLDSAFIGVLVVTLKQLMRLGGTIKIVKPGLFSKSLLNLTGSIEIFELYESLEAAIQSFQISNKSSQFTATGLDRIALAQ
ncbi:MAG: hypothetical protein B6D44_14645 [Ignavibacteriales bacterium UTCHB2]|jgi:anti-anti-sigma regulatory factor|nr:MAG: hypothetical protein BWY38_00029 [Ignavibacteria bacterium ADurb.Bin266]OQY70691.1 MAG: hypothetical protein B6D44_14645 [Ignavibacteriales bacterium UTCHB2]